MTHIFAFDVKNCIRFKAHSKIQSLKIKKLGRSTMWRPDQGNCLCMHSEAWRVDSHDEASISVSVCVCVCVRKCVCARACIYDVCMWIVKFVNRWGPCLVLITHYTLPNPGILKDPASEHKCGLQIQNLQASHARTGKGWRLVHKALFLRGRKLYEARQCLLLLLGNDHRQN
jgi:hypothetical protein